MNTDKVKRLYRAASPRAVGMAMEGHKGIAIVYFKDTHWLVGGEFTRNVKMVGELGYLERLE